MSKERKTWIDDQVNLETSKRLTLVKLSQKASKDDSLPLSASLLDNGWDKVMSTLESRGFNFKPELKETLFNVLSYVAWSNEISNLTGILNDLGSDVRLCDRETLNLGIGYCPIKRSIKNQYTGDIREDDLHVLLLWSDVPIVECENGSIACDCHPLQGIYMADANVIVCDLTMADNSLALCHEMYHCVIKSLREYLDGAMYDQGADQREEICVHFMTDGFDRLSNIRKLFSNIGDGVCSTASDCENSKWDGTSAKKFTISLKSSKSKKAPRINDLREMKSCSFSDTVQYLSKCFELSNSFRSFKSNETHNSISHCSYKSKFEKKWRYKDGK